MVEYYTSGLVNIRVLTSLDGGVTFTYQHIIGSPFTIGVGILDMEVYESDEDIVLGGFGITKNSFLDTLPVPKAGTDFQIKIEPRNEYD